MNTLDKMQENPWQMENENALTFLSDTQYELFDLDNNTAGFEADWLTNIAD